jgi:stage III sporulation protein AB
MDYKWIGAVLIISACAGFGFSLSRSHRQEESSLRNLIGILDFMASELHYQATPLPELCCLAGKECRGALKDVFSTLARELDENLTPNVVACMETALSAAELPPVTYQNLKLLGSSLGRFDLEGQLKSLEAVRNACRTDLETLTADREVRFRNYQTLSLCGGAALAILLI